tara:strand:- start:189 stop:584 length:396 start_codon:yes stop_codon:yes gene_type:complete
MTQADTKSFWQRYREVIESDRWLKMREEYIYNDPDVRCERCRKKSSVYQMHHRHYSTLGKEDRRDLEILCIPCHRKADDERREQQVSDHWRNRVLGWSRSSHDDLSFMEAEEELKEYLDKIGEDYETGEDE